jgi:centromere protein J
MCVDSEEEDDQSGVTEAEDQYELKFEPPYHTQEESKVVQEITSQDGKVHKLYQDGRKEVIFHNGVRREQWPDGYSVVFFTNGDIKQTFPPGHKR